MCVFFFLATDSILSLALESENTKRTDKQTIGPDGGELELDHYGVHMTIPAGALDDNQEIIMKLLSSPPEPAIQEGEMLASFGVQLNPCGLKFKKPVQIRLPHCARITSTSPVEMVLYHSRGKMKAEQFYIKKVIISKAIPRISDFQRTVYACSIVGRVVL